MEKKSFILYTSFYEPIQSLDLLQKGTLLDAIFLHAMGREIPAMDAATAVAFGFVGQMMDDTAARWEETRRKRAEAGRQGGAPRGNTNASKQAKTSKNKQTETKQPVNVNVNVNGISNIAEANASVSASVADAGPSSAEVMGYWNEKTNGRWGLIKSLANNRRKMAMARIAENGWDTFRKAVDMAVESEWLREATWFTFDWMVRPNNFDKLIAGNYQRIKRNNGNGHNSIDISANRPEDYNTAF